MFANERGQSTLEGVVEFVRKPGAQAALRRCTDGCFFLTSSLRPVVVEPMEQLDDEDGFSERAFAKKTADFLKEREVISQKILPLLNQFQTLVFFRLHYSSTFFSEHFNLSKYL